MSGRCVFAHTPVVDPPTYPPYVNVSRTDDGRYRLFIRGAPRQRGPMLVSGAEAFIEIGAEQLRELAAALAGEFAA